MQQNNYPEILKQIYSDIQEDFGKGKVADYIPALAEVDSSQFAMHITTIDGKEYGIGDFTKSFSIQSISKVFTITLAIKSIGDKIWERVGKEPSGTSFNSLVQLEYENGIPRNPFINAGAIVISDIIFDKLGKTKNQVLQFIKMLSNNPTLIYDEEVAESERQYGDKNRALANLIKSFGNLKHDANDVLDVYFHQCSIAMSAQDLSRSLIYLANKGKSLNGEEIISARHAKRINALMLTCGLYDAVGDFAYRVGLPAKSGVGGGIAAIIPDELVVTVWSPELNSAGNSYIGTKALELFTTYASNSIF
jgi:glutaminase